MSCALNNREQLAAGQMPPTEIVEVRSDASPMVYLPGAVSGARLLVRPRQRQASLALIRSAIDLAALSLYGMVAHAVTCRRKEFGIRLDLGAQQADIRQLELKGTSAILAIGLTGGLAGALLACAR